MNSMYGKARVNSMNKKWILTSTILIVSMMLSLNMLPALAKPNQVVVVVRDADGRHVASRQVEIKQGAQDTVAQTDTHGKAVFTLGDEWSANLKLSVYVYDYGLGGYRFIGDYDLSSNLSARITATVSA